MWKKIKQNLLKKILAIIVLNLFLITNSWSDDIKDYQLEGMSIGDGLLSYISKKLLTKELNGEFAVWYHNNKFVSVSLWEEREKFKVYEDVNVIIKPNDEDYKIYALEGVLTFGQNIEKCYEEQKKRVSEFQEEFGKNAKLSSWAANNNKEIYLKKIKHEDFTFASGAQFRIICYDVHEGYERRQDSMIITLNSKEFTKFLFKHHASK